MSVNSLSKETELRLNEFFNQETDPKSFAKTIRKVNYLLALSLMRECETMQIDSKSVEEGYFWLNELAEILNPYMEIELLNYNKRKATVKWLFFVLVLLFRIVCHSEE